MRTAGDHNLFSKTRSLLLGVAVASVIAIAAISMSAADATVSVFATGLNRREPELRPAPVELVSALGLMKYSRMAARRRR